MDEPNHFVGVDLSGPGNASSTAVAVFRPNGEDLALQALDCGADDVGILGRIAASAVVGLDAPLSYSPSGGSRESDDLLRKRTVQEGLPPGSVMAPSAPRMVFLTLRGVAVSRMLGQHRPQARIVEVHPGAALVLHGAPVASVREMKTERRARQELLEWLEGQGLEGLGGKSDVDDHTVAACAAAFAAWKWQQGASKWRYAADPPCHPYDFAC